MSKDIQQFDFNVDILNAVLWQYDGAPNLLGILNAKNEWYNTNQTDFWQNYITNIFDIRTANDFGMSVWSIILGQSIVSPFSSIGDVWGFDSYNENFDNGSFGNEDGGNNIYSLEISRLLLRLRYFQLISSGTVPETNRMLAYLFSPYGKAYLIDNHDMTQTYMFQFVIPVEMEYMLNNTDILPRPAGVKSTIIGM
jgi:hypothetical protein